MKIYRLPPLSVCSTNCYIVESAESKNAVLIDAPENAQLILARLDELGLSLKKILLTHGHCDHTGAVAQLADKTGCEVYIHQLDKPMLSDTYLNLADYITGGVYDCCESAVEVKDGDVIKQNELEFMVLHTPGHTKGSVCYKLDKVLFTGDTLFAGSVGRVDFPGGNVQQQRASLKRLKEIDEDLTIYAGHGEASTLSKEKNYNMYMTNV